MTDHQRPTRRDLGAVAASKWGADWSDRLAEFLAINPRTAERWGGPKFPLDARRLLITAENLLDNAPSDPGARHLAAWCVRKARQEIEALGRRDRVERNPASGV